MPVHIRKIGAFFERSLKAVLWLSPLIFALSTPAYAQMSLQEAVLIATASDPSVEALRQKVAAKNVDIQAARDAYFPSISLSGDSSTTDSDGPGVTLSVTQVLFDWGRTRNQIAEASQVRVQAVSDLKMAVEDLTFEIAGFFLDVEVMDRKISYTKEYMTFARRLAGQTQDRAAAGVSDNSEVARARLEISRADEQMSQLMANRQIAMAQLEFLIGQKVDAVQLPPSLLFSDHYGSRDKINAAIRIAPGYIAARAAVAEAEAGVQVAKAQRFPTINLQAQGRMDLNGGDTQTAVGISAGVDLNSRGFGQRKIQSAQLAVEGAKASLQGQERQLMNIASSALERLSLLRRSEQSREVQLVEAGKVLQTYEKQFVAGQREILDLLTTGRDLYDAQIDKIDTYDERKRTEYEAAKDLGVLGTMLLAGSTVQ
ncbi:MAG: TolC family protein [Alphaproteobacteria bacterium]|nr:TolC family protein [Alphaproteobacteria bacterium]MBU1572519.1 TolC family protein [Alphaproteobacteria bacterium]MBU2076804.1 TolC family protein [Alphaproteobacteria bacterium]MBU2161837.1 TolC family protein [Alphaproteobacteria bacterium]MBU2242037.1 TolC family protein [Alphaproteobacteria bacterium]